MMPLALAIAGTRPGFRWWPEQASRSAEAVDADAIMLTIFCGTILLVVAGLMITYCIKYRAGSKANRSNVFSHPRRIEIGWTIGIAVLALAIFAWTIHVFLDLQPRDREGHTIYVVAKQWMWKFQHPGGRREINELHIPAGRRIRLVMTSQDVIHSLYIPAFRRKQDLLPDRFTILTFEATRYGHFDLYCAEYCGHDHSDMAAQVVVVSPEDYERWLEPGAEGERGQPATRVQADGPSTGQGAFFDLGCHACHFSDSGIDAPPLEGLFGREVLLRNDRTVIADEHYIRESILHPDAKIVAGYPAPSPMPTFQGRITTEQLIELVEFIRSLSHAEEGP